MICSIRMTFKNIWRCSLGFWANGLRAPMLSLRFVDQSTFGRCLIHRMLTLMLLHQSCAANGNVIGVQWAVWISCYAVFLHRWVNVLQSPDPVLVVISSIYRIWMMFVELCTRSLIRPSTASLKFIIQRGRKPYTYHSLFYRNTFANLQNIMEHKFNLLGNLALKKNDLKNMLNNLMNIEKLTHFEIMNIYECNI